MSNFDKEAPLSLHDAEVNGSEKSDSSPTLKLDAHGLPLVPQPSDHKDDPLVCPNCSFASASGNRD
jgi:hypothetical protein